MTIKLARKHQRPWLYIDLGVEQDHVALVSDWLVEWDIKVLNVAGSRESKAPGIYNQVKDILTQTLGYPDHNGVADVVMEFAVMD